MTRKRSNFPARQPSVTSSTPVSAAGKTSFSTTATIWAWPSAVAGPTETQNAMLALAARVTLKHDWGLTVRFLEALDETLNEVQRMRSVVQLQPGEQREFQVEIEVSQAE